MGLHHLRLAFRALRRDTTNAVLGGLSLAVAIAACVLIALFVRGELRYDRALPNADRVSSVALESEFGGERSAHLSTPYVLSGHLRAEAPSVETATTVLPTANSKVLRDGGDLDVRALYADSLFFDVFALPVVAGDVRTALDAPGGVVLTASVARRVFGDAGAVGEDLTVLARGDTLAVTVRAVVSDLPEPSSLGFEAILPVADFLTRNDWVGTEWGANMWWTYALRRPGADPDALQRSLDAIAAQEPGGQIMRLLDVPLLDFRLSEFSQAEGFGGDPVYLRLFTVVAGLILLLGAINYVNLATARGARRAKEIGVRKALGASVGGLVGLLSREYLALVAVAAVLAAPVAVVLVRRWLEGFAYHAPFSPLVLVGATLAALVLALASVGAQAARVARRDPVHALRSE